MMQTPLACELHADWAHEAAVADVIEIVLAETTAEE
jgi:hypothetical protein